MNKRKIIKMVIELQKEICKSCKQKDYDMCQQCLFHILTNQIIEELNGE